MTADSKYIYVAMQQSHSGHPGQDYPPGKTNWRCVRRYDLKGKPAPFPGGRGWDKSMLIVSMKNYLIISASSYRKYEPGSHLVR